MQLCCLIGTATPLPSSTESSTTGERGIEVKNLTIKHQIQQQQTTTSDMEYYLWIMDKKGQAVVTAFVQLRCPLLYTKLYVNTFPLML